MRTISAALTAAQKSASRDPAIAATVRNDIECVRRLDFTSLNTTFNAVGKHDIAVDDEGNVHRVRNDAGTIYHQKLTPAQQTTPSNWDSWTSMASGVGSAAIAVAARGARVIIVFPNNPGTSTRYRESTDHGASFTAEATYGAHGSAVVDSAVAYKDSAGDLCVFTALSNDTMQARMRVAGVIGSTRTLTAFADSLSGVAATFAFDYEVLITGAEITTLRPSVWSETFLNVSDAWGALNVQFQGEAALTGFAAPFLTFLDTWRATFVELPAYTGGITRTERTYLHPLETWNRIAFLLRTALPTDHGIAQGLAVAHGGSPGYFFESGYDLVRRAPTDLVSLDIEPDIQQLEIHESTLDTHGFIDLVNPDDPVARRYAMPPPAPIQLGNMVRLGFGYKAVETYPRVATGSFVGNETARSFDVGFQPDLVWLLGEADYCVYKGADAVFGTKSFGIAGNVIAASGITSLTDTGFNIGNDVLVNKTGDTFYYVAIRDPDRIACGTYVGTAPTPQSITGVGFLPVYVSCQTDDGSSAHVKTTDMGAESRQLVQASGGTTSNGIKTLDAVGFSLGTSFANGVGSLYYYVAIAAGPGLLIGTYTGNGVDDRNIVAADVDFLFLINRNTSGTRRSLVRIDTMPAGNAWDTVGNFLTNAIQLLAPNLQVGTAVEANESTREYYYVGYFQPSSVAGALTITSEIQDLWITAIEHRRDQRRGRAVLRLYVEGALRRLKRLVQPGSISHTADDYRQILSAIMSRAGVSLSVTNASSRSDSVIPRFHIDPDDTAHQAMTRALAFLADRIYMSNTSTAKLTDLVGGAASVYALKNEEYVDDETLHPFHAHRLRSAPPPTGEVHVASLTAAMAYLGGLATDHQAADLGLSPLTRIRDLSSDAISEADATADVHILQRRFERDDGMVTCPPIMGLELLDVITITDPYASDTAITKRVSAITWRLDRTRGRGAGRTQRGHQTTIYEQEIHLAPATDQDNSPGAIE